MGNESPPIWMAALAAAQPVSWGWQAGRAVYTNTGVAPQQIEPLGVKLEGGQTLSVYWLPGETTYTVEVLPS